MHEFPFAQATNPMGDKEKVMKPLFLTLLAVLGLGLATIEATAEIWPTKPLRAIVPVGAGSTTDIIPRIVFEQLALQLGHRDERSYVSEIHTDPYAELLWMPRGIKHWTAKPHCVTAHA